MSFDAAPLLERHRVFHSRDAEETRAFLGRKDYRFDPTWVGTDSSMRGSTPSTCQACTSPTFTMVQYPSRSRPDGLAKII